MARQPHRAEHFREKQYSDIIDVRSPSEFAIDHLPGAINLPVLSDEERVEVGTIYKQQTSFSAKKLGAGYIAKNISAHLLGVLANKDENFKPLIYCWRGGMRSGALAHILAQIGYDVSVLLGGYKGYRRALNAELPAKIEAQKFKVVCGLTGSGKTLFLKWLEKNGHQVLDLEGLANHRGSLLGSVPGVQQPTQKSFESQLAEKLSAFDVSRDVWVESEGYKIGSVELPRPLWARMRNAARVEIDVPVAARIDLLINEYVHFIQNPEEFLDRLQLLHEVVGREKLNNWVRLTCEQQWSALVESLLLDHYDPSYSKALLKNFVGPLQVMKLNAINEEEFITAFAKLV